MKALPPVIKWSGSKRSVAAQLAALLPSTGTYFEPFLGGGAVLGTQAGRESFASDIVPELIGIWQAIKDDPDAVIAEYRTRWQRLQTEGHTAFYAIRDSFNSSRNPNDLLFLSRTCVNGLIRFNKDGNFNNSLHHTRKGIDPRRLAQVVSRWNSSLQHTAFATCDFEEALSNARSGDVAFLDPPYVGTRGRYHPGVFAFERLWAVLESLNSKGVSWVLTLDGTAGDRDYGAHWVPEGLYEHRLSAGTGSSPFARVMEARVDAVRESVFLNFDLEALSKSPNSLDNRLETWSRCDVNQGTLFLTEELDPEGEVEFAAVESRG